MKNVVLLLIVATGLSACQYIPGTEANEIVKAKASVAEKLKDPTSPLFSDIKVVSGGVCGQVNGKNSYGAYGGKSGFVWSLGSSYIEDINAPDDIRSQLEQCQYRALYEACAAGQSLYNNEEYDACADTALEAIEATYRTR